MSELLTSELIKQEPYRNKYITRKLVERWTKNKPDWMDHLVYPLKPLDLTSYGYGFVFIKDESDYYINPTGTMKDRQAEKLAADYIDMMAKIYKALGDGVPLPRYSLITSGNEGASLAYRFGLHRLPPPKLLIDINTPQEKIDQLLPLRADIYATDLSIQELSPQDIVRLTDNPRGWDATSRPLSLMLERSLNGQLNYGSLAVEILAEFPDEIYVPYGSGKLFADCVLTQVFAYGGHMALGELSQIPIQRIVRPPILGAEPMDSNTTADKLWSPFKPFSPYIFLGKVFPFWKELGAIQSETNVYPLKEYYLKQATEIMNNNGFDTEPSASAGLGLYLQRVTEDGARIGTNSDHKIIIVNTGSGIY